MREGRAKEGHKGQHNTYMRAREKEKREWEREQGKGMLIKHK